MAADSVWIHVEGTGDSIALARTQADTPRAGVQPVETVSCRPQPWTEGLQPAALPRTQGWDVSWVGLLLITAVVLLAVRGRVMVRTLSAMLTTATCGLPDRATFHDEHIADPVIQCTLWPLLVLGMGVVADAFVPEGVSVPLLWLVAVAVIYYALMWAAYLVAGWTFATDDARYEWLRGFVATQGLAAIAVALPAIGILFYPTAGRTLAWVAIILWLLARCLFIIKGFRIFYDQFYTSLYFILYLCTLEIAPLVVVCTYLRGTFQ